MIDCYCDYDQPTFYKNTIRTARKLHKCDECGGIIFHYEKYEYVSSLTDDYFWTARTCERCFDLRQWVKNNVPCFCWMHGNMHEAARDSVEEAAFRAPEETVGLRFGFLRRLVKLQKYNAERRQAA